MSEYVFGIHPVEELLTVQDRRIVRIWIQRGAGNARLQQIIQTARSRCLEIRFEGRTRMDRLIGGGRHQGVIVLCEAKTILPFNTFLKIPEGLGEDPFFLILDRVEDPRNLGAVIRTAYAAGVHGVILPGRGTAPLTGTVYKCSAGALERIAVTQVNNLVRTIRLLKERGIWVVGADAGARDRYMDVDFSGPVALVVGGEQGIRRLVRKNCDRMVSIPMKGAESLNLSVAAAILLYEVVRRRRPSDL